MNSKYTVPVLYLRTIGVPVLWYRTVLYYCTEYCTTNYVPVRTTTTIGGTCTYYLYEYVQYIRLTCCAMGFIVLSIIIHNMQLYNICDDFPVLYVFCIKERVHTRAASLLIIRYRTVYRTVYRLKKRKTLHWMTFENCSKSVVIG